MTCDPYPTPPRLTTAAPQEVADFDAAHFRRSMAQFATGVTVVTSSRVHGAGSSASASDSSDAGPHVGVTISSFSSVSLAPPLVLWSLGVGASSLPVFEANAHHVVHVLGAHQAALSQHFAYARGDKFAGTDYRLNAHGVPVLAGVNAWFECRVRSRYTEGDHVIFVSDVLRCGHAAGQPPLVYAQGQLGTLAPLV